MWFFWKSISIYLIILWISYFFNFYNHLFLNVIIKNIKIIYKYNQKGIKYWNILKLIFYLILNND